MDPKTFPLSLQEEIWEHSAIGMYPLAIVNSQQSFVVHKHTQLTTGQWPVFTFTVQNVDLLLSLYIDLLVDSFWELDESAICLKRPRSRKWVRFVGIGGKDVLISIGNSNGPNSQSTDLKPSWWLAGVMGM